MTSSNATLSAPLTQRQAKWANDLGLSADVVQDELRRRLLEQMPSALGNLAILGVGAGAGLSGLRRMLRLNKEQDRSEAGGRSPVRQVRIYKHAGILESAANWISDTTGGQNITSLPQHPMFLPAAGLSLAGGAAAGYLGTEAILKKIRQKSQEARLEKAKREYIQALSGPQPGKVASERGQLAQAIDRIVAVLDRDGELGDKTAMDIGKSTSRLSGLLLGLYLTAGIGAGAYGAHLGYKKQQSNSKVKAIQRAQQERANQQAAYTPTAITVDLASI